MKYLLLFHGNNDMQTSLSVTSYSHCLSCFVLGCVHTMPLYASWQGQMVLPELVWTCSLARASWQNRAKWLPNSNPTSVGPLQREPRHFEESRSCGRADWHHGCCSNQQILVGIHFATECHFLLWTP